MGSEFCLNEKASGIYSGTIFTGTITKMAGELVELEVANSQHVVIPIKNVFHTFAEALTAFQSQFDEKDKIETAEGLLRFAIDNNLISKKNKKLYAQFVETAVQLGIMKKTT